MVDGRVGYVHVMYHVFLDVFLEIMMGKLTVVSPLRNFAFRVSRDVKLEFPKDTAVDVEPEHAELVRSYIPGILQVVKAQAGKPTTASKPTTAATATKKRTLDSV